MAHARKPRKLKGAQRLISTDQALPVPAALPSVPGNEVMNLSEAERQEILSTIGERVASAQPITDALSEKMRLWEKQYYGRWENAENDDAEHFYLTKSRERLHVVRAFLLYLASQLPQLVSFRPKVRTLSALKEDWDKAKIAEALLNHDLDDKWRFRNDILPGWVTCFLKHSIAIYKVTWNEDPQRPDLRFEVVDRALQYIDPLAHDCRDARWWYEKAFKNRAECEE